MNELKKLKIDYYANGDLQDFDTIFENILHKANENMVEYLNTIKAYRENSFKEASKDRDGIIDNPYNNEPITIEDFSVYKKHRLSLFNLIEKYNGKRYHEIGEKPFLFHRISIRFIFRYLWAAPYIELTTLDMESVFYKTHEEFFMLAAFTSNHDDNSLRNGGYMALTSVSSVIDMPRLKQKKSSDRVRYSRDRNELDDDIFSEDSYRKFWCDVAMACAKSEGVEEFVDGADIMDRNIFVAGPGVVVFRDKKTSLRVAVTPYGVLRGEGSPIYSYYKKFKKDLNDVDNIDEITLQRLLWWFGIETDLRGSRKIFDTSLCKIDWSNETIKDLFMTKYFSS